MTLFLVSVFSVWAVFQVVWLKERIERVPTRLIFESALELMSMTQVGTFTMGSGGQSQGPPPAVKALLSKFGSKREEDKLKGYLSFLKIGPKILKLVPGKKAKDVRTWLVRAVTLPSYH